MKHDSINKSSQRFLSDVIRKIISTESIDEAFRDILTDTLRCYSAGRVVGLHILDRNLNLIYKSEGVPKYFGTPSQREIGGY